MTLSFPNTAHIKQYLPGLYFIGVSLWLSYEYQSIWLAALALPFVVQVLLNNRYLNLLLGVFTIVWSMYMVFDILSDAQRTVQFLTIAVSVIFLNLYMSRMLFLNQNFAMAQLRENSLDEILFL